MKSAIQTAISNNDPGALLHVAHADDLRANEGLWLRKILQEGSKKLASVAMAVLYFEPQVGDDALIRDIIKPETVTDDQGRTTVVPRKGTSDAVAGVYSTAIDVLESAIALKTRLELSANGSASGRAKQVGNGRDASAGALQSLSRQALSRA